MKTEKNKNQVPYVYTVTMLFFEYLKGLRTKGQLITSLMMVETEIKDILKVKGVELNGDESLWFRFGSDDPLVNTIEDMKIMLEMPENHPNHKHILNKMELITGDINPENEIQIYYS